MVSAGSNLSGSKQAGEACKDDDLSGPFSDVNAYHTEWDVTSRYPRTVGGQAFSK